MTIGVTVGRFGKTIIADMRKGEPMGKLIDYQAAIDAINALHESPNAWLDYAVDAIMALPSAQPEIIRCKDCEYGEQDDIGRWSCSSLGCQIGSDDGSGYCANAERRTDG